MRLAVRSGRHPQATALSSENPSVSIHQCYGAIGTVGMPAIRMPRFRHSIDQNIVRMPTRAIACEALLDEPAGLRIPLMSACAPELAR